jgi:N-methylhydantoinase B
VNDRPVHPKGRYLLSADDVMTVVGPGGGGFFPPGERDPRLVLEDVVNGLVSEGQAREVYRVAVDPASRAIDWDETARLRAGADTASADAAVG